MREDMRFFMPDRPVEDKSKIRDQLNKAVQEYLDKGGEIQKIPHDYSAIRAKECKQSVRATQILINDKRRGDAYRIYRENAGLCKSEAARAAGVGISTIHRIEAGICKDPKILSKVRAIYEN